MTRRSMIGRAVAVVAVLFIAVNLFGAAVAAAQGELLHTGIHVGLLLLSALLVWRMAPRRVAGESRLAADQRAGAPR